MPCSGVLRRDVGPQAVSVIVTVMGVTSEVAVPTSVIAKACIVRLSVSVAHAGHADVELSVSTPLLTPHMVISPPGRVAVNSN
jgi:hypothetical protein